MKPTESKHRRIVVGAALGITLLAAGTLTYWRHITAGPKSGPKNSRVTVTSDPAAIVGCVLIRKINLSGAVGGGNDLQNESDRDRYLSSIAADEGANVVLILERGPDLVRSRGYRCPEKP